MRDDDNRGVMVIGTLAIVILFAVMCMKFITALLIQLTKAWSAFGGMMGAFFYMLLALGKVVFLASLIIGCVVISCYGVYKYIKLVKQGTQLESWVKGEVLYARQEVRDKISEFQHEVSDQLGTISKEVELIRNPPPPKEPDVPEILADTQTSGTLDSVANPY